MSRKKHLRIVRKKKTTETEAERRRQVPRPECQLPRDETGQSVHTYCRTSPPAAAFSVHILLRIPVNYTPARILFLELRNMQTQTVRNVEYFSQLVQGKGKNNLNKI